MAKQIDTLSPDQADALEFLVDGVLAEQSAVEHYERNLADGRDRLAAAQKRLDAALRAVGLTALDADKAAEGSKVRAVRDEAGKVVEIHLDDPA